MRFLQAKGTCVFLKFLGGGLMFQAGPCSILRCRTFFAYPGPCCKI